MDWNLEIGRKKLFIEMIRFFKRV